MGDSVFNALQAGRPLTEQELRGATRAQLRLALKNRGITADTELTGRELRKLLRFEYREGSSGKALSPISAGVEKTVNAAKRKAGSSRPNGSE